MPRTRSLAWSELKIGMLTISAIVIAAVTIFLLTGQRGFAWQRYSLKTRFANAAGLQTGSPVRLAGVDIGSVTGVDVTGEEVEVVFEVNKDKRDRITTGSTAILGSVSLLGQASVDISPSTRGMPIEEWGYVPSGRPAAALSDVTTQAAEGVEEITKLVKDIRAGRGTFGRLMTDDRLALELERFVTTAGDVTRTIRDGRGTIGRFINDPKIANSLEGAARNMEDVTRRINAGEGSLGKLLNDDAFARSLSAATNNLQTLSERLNRGEGTAGKLLTDPALFNRLNALTGRLDELVTRLNEGQGSLGQLLKDRQLYENMNKAVNELTSLVAEIRRDPKKYLNVKMSIF